MFVTVNFSAPIGTGDSQLIYQWHEADGYPQQEWVNLGNWRDISQWSDHLDGYIDQAMLRQIHGNQQTIDKSRRQEIINLVEQIRQRVLTEPIQARLTTNTPISLRPFNGLSKRLPWEAMTARSNPFGSAGYCLDPGVPKMPRHKHKATALLVLDPTASFNKPEVLDHFEQVRQAVSNTGLEVLVLNSADYSTLRGQLQNPCLALFYYFGHMDRASNGEGQLVLARDTRLSASDLWQNLKPTANIVVLNGCDAAGSPLPANDIQTINMAEAFGRSGAQFIAGATRRIPWQSAIAADHELLLPYLDGKTTAAVAINNFRKASIERFEQGQADFAWAVYRVFANPTLTAKTALQPADEATPQTDLGADLRNKLSPELIDIVSNPEITTLQDLQKHVVSRIAPRLSETAPRDLSGAASPINLTATPELDIYLRDFIRRQPDGNLSSLLRDMIEQQPAIPHIAGVSSTDLGGLLAYREQIAHHAPLTPLAADIVQQAAELSIVNGWQRLTNRAVLAVLLTAPDSYLTQACQLSHAAHFALSELLQGLHHGASETDSSTTDSMRLSVLERWLECAERLRNGAGAIDERALALAFCQVVDPILRTLLAQLPAPLHIDLEAAQIVPVPNSEQSVMSNTQLAPSAQVLIRNAHALACKFGEHPIPDTLLFHRYFNRTLHEPIGAPLSYPLDDRALSQTFMQAIAWGTRRYGWGLEANELIRSLWLHLNAAQRQRVASIAHTKTVEGAMLAGVESNYLFHCLDEASILASAQGVGQVRLPHLYCGVLEHDGKALAPKLHVAPDDTHNLFLQLLRSVVPGGKPPSPRTTSEHSDSVHNFVANYLQANSGQAFDEGAFRFRLATPSHVVVEAVLSSFQQT